MPAWSTACSAAGCGAGGIVVATLRSTPPIRCRPLRLVHVLVAVAHQPPPPRASGTAAEGGHDGPARPARRPSHLGPAARVDRSAASTSPGPRAAMLKDTGQPPGRLRGDPRPVPARRPVPIWRLAARAASPAAIGGLGLAAGMGLTAASLDRVPTRYFFVATVIGAVVRRVASLGGRAEPSARPSPSTSAPRSPLSQRRRASPSGDAAGLVVPCSASRARSASSRGSSPSSALAVAVTASTSKRPMREP